MCAACLKLIYIVLPWFFACRSSRAKPSLLKRAAKCASAIAMPLDLLARQVCATLQRCCMVFAVTPKSHQQAPLLGAWIAIYSNTRANFTKTSSTKPFWNSNPNETSSCEHQPPKPVIPAPPTALAKPCPKGPVVTSTPLVIRNSGCPGVLLPAWQWLI